MLVSLTCDFAISSLMTLSYRNGCQIRLSTVSCGMYFNVFSNADRWSVIPSFNKESISNWASILPTGRSINKKVSYISIIQNKVFYLKILQFFWDTAARSLSISSLWNLFYLRVWINMIHAQQSKRIYNYEIYFI